MKKTVGFRFATGTLEKLKVLSEGSTRTAVLERLILEASEDPLKEVEVLSQKAALIRKSGPTPDERKTIEQKTIDTPAEAERYAKDVGRGAEVSMKPVGKPRRRINPMTGKPFGAVPK